MNDEHRNYPNTWFYLIIIFLLLGIMAARVPLDSDMWWHLRAGEVTWQTRTPLLSDIFSHTVFGKDWVNHSWLAQVIMFLIYGLGENVATTIWVSVTAAFSFLLLYFVMDGPPILRAFIIIFGAIVAAPVFTPRPQLFSLFLFSLSSLILYISRTQNSKIVFWLLPIFLLWSNLHGGYVLGFILIIGSFVGELLDWTLQRNYQNQAPNSSRGEFVKFLVVVGILNFFLIAINPNGIKVWLIPFQTIGVDTLQDTIPEWASPNFHNIFEQPYIWLLLGTFVAVGLSKSKISGADLVVFCLFAYLGLLSRRNFGPFAVIAAPLLSRQIMGINENLHPKVGEFLLIIRKKLKHQSPKPISRSIRLAADGFIIFLLGVALILKISYVTSPDIFGTVENKNFPVEAVVWLSENKTNQNLFNEYSWGGYLIWHLRDYPVFVDGRTDLYGDQILSEYLQIMSGGNNWQKALDYYGIETVIVPNSTIIEDKLLISNSWSLVYKDDLASIFVVKTR